MKPYERHLTERDHDILEFVVRYRIGTPELVRQACFEPSTTVENVTRVLQRLQRRELVHRVVALRSTDDQRRTVNSPSCATSTRSAREIDPLLIAA